MKRGSTVETVATVERNADEICMERRGIINERSSLRRDFSSFRKPINKEKQVRPYREIHPGRHYSTKVGKSEKSGRGDRRPNTSK